MSKVTHGPHMLNSIVTDRPFMGDVEETIRRRTFWGRIVNERMSGALYRDRQGRVRQEYTLREFFGTTRLASIVDPVRRYIFALNIQAKTYTEMAVNLTPPQSEAAAAAAPDGETREIEGQSCRRVVVPGARVEIWISKDLNQLVLENGEKNGQPYTWRLFNIRQIDPPAELFLVPNDFRRGAN